jgi:hypothetical protein
MMPMMKMMMKTMMIAKAMPDPARKSTMRASPSPHPCDLRRHRIAISGVKARLPREHVAHAARPIATAAAVFIMKLKWAERASYPPNYVSDVTAKSLNPINVLQLFGLPASERGNHGTPRMRRDSARGGIAILYGRKINNSGNDDDCSDPRTHTPS